MSDAEIIEWTLSPETTPVELRDWLASLPHGAVTASLELLPNGSILIQALPEIDPRVVARLRRTIGQYEDVLRRLT